MENSECTSYLLLASIRDRFRTVNECGDSILAALQALERKDNRVLFVLPWGCGIGDVFDAFRGRGWIEVDSSGEAKRYHATELGRRIVEAKFPELREHFGFDPVTVM